MSDALDDLRTLAQTDPRYKLEAYLFVFEALAYAQEVLGLGRLCPSEPLPGEAPGPELAEPQKHVTGQELCEAARLYALERYGLMAKAVLNSWGIRSTSDFGEIVFNLIRCGRMRKTREDRREDFDNVYNFEEAFQVEIGLLMDGPSRLRSTHKPEAEDNRA
ncbi:MAG: hypothetical protein NZ899_08275 [Thermoguttaceae bacterium]|nr:hypothetical protein [Thermoguttaceae bacterium]MDW8078388.1 hypothetical protein [Thermoguttaceae bacterium]